MKQTMKMKISWICGLIAFLLMPATAMADKAITPNQPAAVQ